MRESNSIDRVIYLYEAKLHLFAVISFTYLLFYSSSHTRSLTLSHQSNDDRIKLMMAVKDGRISQDQMLDMISKGETIDSVAGSVVKPALEKEKSTPATGAIPPRPDSVSMCILLLLVNKYEVRVVLLTNL